MPVSVSKIATALLPTPFSASTALHRPSSTHLFQKLSSSAPSIAVRRRLPSISHSINKGRDSNPPIGAVPTSTHDHNALFQTLSATQKEQISLYVRTLLQWNQRMNLTAVKEEGEVMTRHVEDSLAMLPPIRRSYEACCSHATSCDDLRVIDVGTGAGLPGLIFAVASPGWKITLLESMRKRCLFLDHAVDLMGLSNVQILCARAEDRVLVMSLNSERHLMWQWPELLRI